MIRYLAATVLVLGLAADQVHAQRKFECLTTTGGIPKKLIIKREEAPIFKDEGGTTEAGKAKFFRKYFVFEEAGGRFLIGDATVKRSILGYVNQEDTIPWDSQEVIFFANKNQAGRIPFRIWRVKTEHGNLDATYFEEDLDRATGTEPFPILSRESNLLNIAFLWEAPEGVLPTLSVDTSADGSFTAMESTTVERGNDGKKVQSEEEVQQKIAEVRRLEIVIVIDTTGSMGSYIAATKAKLKSLVETLAGMSGQQSDIRVGIVAYRDYGDQSSSYLTQEFPLSSSMPAVMGALSKLSPAGGGGLEEAVCHAVDRARLGMEWTESAHKVLVLVSDAPPHTATDGDIRTLQAAGFKARDEFFGKAREANLRNLRGALEQQGIQVYGLAVGSDTTVADSFAKIAKDSSMVRKIGDAEAFVATLAKDLAKEETAHIATTKLVEEVVEGTKRVSDLTRADLERFEAINLDPKELRELSEEKILEGWVDVKEDRNLIVCVYARRQDLNELMIDLRGQILEGFSDQPEMMSKILEMITGSEVDASSAGDLLRAADNLAYQIDMLTFEGATKPEEAKKKNLARRLADLQILLQTEGLFNEFEEGWVPLKLLPGSMYSAGE